MHGDKSPAGAPGSERSCSELALDWCSPRYGAFAIAERIVSLRPPTGRSCWRAHVGYMGEDGRSFLSCSGDRRPSRHAGRLQRRDVRP
jgi:hypothetical protein